MCACAGILIEDQVAPKSCGHVQGKQVVGREEAVARIRAAVDARDEGADILIVARTDARQAVSLEEALWRVQVSDFVFKFVSNALVMLPSSKK